MPEIFARRQIVPTRLTSSATSGNPVSGSLDGALHTMEWRQARIWEGRGYHVSIGAFSTPITGGGAGTVFDQDQPEGVISVPSGTSILPIRINVQCQVPLLATDADESEILIAVDRAAVSNASASTGTAETIYNMRTDLAAGASLATATSANTSNITNPTLDIELARMVVTGDVQGTAANGLWTPLTLLYEPAAPPLIVGPAALYIYWGGTVATPGFAQVEWIEVPTPPQS